MTVALSWPGYANTLGGEPVLMTVFPAPARPKVPGEFRPRVAVVFMHNGDSHPGAARGFYRSRFDCQDVDVIAEMEVISSFVPQAYNIGLHHALELRDQGVATHFAMLHADISPEPAWIDGLWREMQVGMADAIAAVAPIKEPQYRRTTTVIGDPGNPWIPKREVLMTDRPNLPTTFGIEHVGDPATEFLQINTGCMLVDLRRDWWDVPRIGAEGDVFAFELMQRVVKIAKPDQQYAAELDNWRAGIAEAEAAGGHERAAHMKARRPLPTFRQTQSRSEDWEMSRHIWQHGGRCVATFGVALEHFGTFAWSNQARVLVKGG
jgi:hypothetical protein